MDTSLLTEQRVGHASFIEEVKTICFIRASFCCRLCQPSRELESSFALLSLLQLCSALNGGHLSCLSCSLAFYQIQNLKHQFFSLSQRGAFYLCEIPLAATLAFWVKLRGRGLWIGIQIRAFVQTLLLLSIITSCIDWEQEVINARKRLFERHLSEDNGLIREDNDEHSI